MLYREYTTTQVLVMEYIDGIGVDEKEKLLEAGYDLDEIGSKMADNYVKQIIEDGFFHADPHPGNMRIRDGKIVWIDMGMMGRFSQRDQVLLGKVIKGVATNDVSLIVEAVLSLGDFHDKPDQKLLYSDIGDWLTKYGNANFGGLNMGTLMQDLMDIMKENRVSMPHSLTMLVRGLTTIEGVIAEIAPDINVVQVAAARMSGNRFSTSNMKEELHIGAKEVWQALQKGIKIPSYISDLLRSYMHGQTSINLDLHATDDLTLMLNALVRRLVMGFLIMALLISVLSGAFLERQTHAEYEYHLEQTAKSQESSATIASNVILNTVLKCASNQSIIRWVNSSSLPEYYFNAIGATKGLQESINNTLPIEYQCALMPLSVKAFNGKIVDMVLTHNRTIAVSELLSTLHIDQQEYLRLIDHFYDSDEPYFLARYDQESQDLENMIYIMKANHTKNYEKRFPDLCDDTKRNFCCSF